MAIPPDPVAALIAWLSDQAELVGITIAGAPPSNLGDGLDTAITVQPVDSPADPPAWNGSPVLFRPRLDIDAYAPDSTVAYDLANTVFGLLPLARNHSGEYGRIGQVLVPSSPSFRPNFTDVTFRWGGTCGLTMRAATSA
jgi:hypothetical protein